MDFLKMISTRNFSICLVIVCCSIQYSIAQGISINPKVGLNYSKYSTEQGVSLESLSKTGYHGGIDFRLSGGAFYFQPGVFYYSSGFLLEPTTIGGALDNEVSVNSVKIPLGLGYNLIHEQNVKMRVFGSAVGNIILDVDENDLGVDLDMYNTLNIGANAGFGFDLFFLTFEAIYELGISDIFNEGDSGIISFGQGAKNNTVSFSVGLRL